jgi:tRNA threonylcarbamoyl adenosine modification protein (Sua5/YciO/YrdC/YwlC family)
MTVSLLPTDQPGVLDAAVAALSDGRIVGIPTETVYGLAVLPMTEPLRALVAAKGRDPGKGIAVLIDGLDQLTGVLVVSPRALRLAERFWPGALTLVLPVREGLVLPDLLTGGRPTLAVRLPDHAVPRELARRIGPLAVSSANRSGEPEAHTATELVAAVGAAPALVLDGGRVRGGRASSVVEVPLEGPVTVLREGAIDRASIEGAIA